MSMTTPNRIITGQMFGLIIALSLFILLAVDNVAQAGIRQEVLLNQDPQAVLEDPGDPDDPDDDDIEFPTLTSAQSAIVIDQQSGAVLGARLPDTRRFIASTTKIMTALLVTEALDAGSIDLDTVVTVSLSAGTMGDVGMGSRAGGSVMGDINGAAQDASVGLSPGDRVSIQDLMYGLLLDSGNDAALALAEAIAGSEQAFVSSMNQRASQLGLNDTRYANPHGRDPQRVDPGNCPQPVFDDSACAHYSTARDLARLTRIALEKPLFAMIVSSRTYQTLNWSAQFSGAVNSNLDNGNSLIRSDRSDNPYVYPGAFGVKTGTTGRAGRCLVSAADSLTNTEHSVIAVILGAASNDDRYTDSAKLLDYGLQVLAQDNLVTHAPWPAGQAAEEDFSLRSDQPIMRCNLHLRFCDGSSSARSAMSNVEFTAP